MSNDSRVVRSGNTAGGVHDTSRIRSHDACAWSSFSPVSRVQNAYAESINGRLRVECLNANRFTSLRDARDEIEIWRQDYNQERQHNTVLLTIEIIQ